ncbi:MAG: formylglycine-generating enzyme family protein [Chitinophagales bacterium]
MVTVQGGTFQMGSNEGEDDKKPIHPVTLNSFQLSKYEVTIGQYLAFVNETKSQYPEWLEKGSKYHIHTGTDDYYKKRGMSESNTSYPITGVSWLNAKAFCDWLVKKTDKRFRLPTEAEWEFAARGGTKSRNYTYAGSNSIGEVAWYDSNSSEKTHPVGGKKSNELGLYDMSGNVWEWCADWYDENYYSNSSSSNPREPTTGSRRVLRGGSWDYKPLNCRSGSS